MCKPGDQIWSTVIRRDLAANACSEVAHERPRSEIVNKVTHTLTCTHARRYPFPWQLKMADVRLKFCAVSSFWSRLQTMVDKASSSVFRKQNATQVATQRSPWTRFASRTLLSVYSHILRGAWRDRDTNDNFAHCSLIFYFFLLQIFQLCLSFWTSSFDLVLF